MNSKKSILAMGLMATILGGGVSSATEERVQMGETQKLWEEDAPVAKSLTDIQALAEHADQLKGKVVTIEGMTIDKTLEDPLERILFGMPLRICFENGGVTDRGFDFFASNDGTDLVIHNCELTAKQGAEILGSLTPELRINVNLAHNKLGEGPEPFLTCLKSEIQRGIQGFSHIDIRCNNFSKEDIFRLENFLKSKSFCGVLF